MTTENTTNEAEYIVTPEGAVTWNALRAAQKSYDGTKMLYNCRTQIDGDTEGAAQCLADIKAINNKAGSTDNVDKPGNYFINGTSENQPKVFDASGKILNPEDIPMLAQGSIVKLILKVKRSTDPKFKSSFRLHGVQLINVNEFEGATDTIDEAALVDALKKG